jgi:hypothetical protein
MCSHERIVSLEPSHSTTVISTMADPMAASHACSFIISQECVVSGLWSRISPQVICGFSSGLVCGVRFVS